MSWNVPWFSLVATDPMSLCINPAVLSYLLQLAGPGGWTVVRTFVYVYRGERSLPSVTRTWLLAHGAADSY